MPPKNWLACRTVVILAFCSVPLLSRLVTSNRACDCRSAGRTSWPKGGVVPGVWRRLVPRTLQEWPVPTRWLDSRWLLMVFPGLWWQKTLKSLLKDPKLKVKIFVLEKVASCPSPRSPENAREIPLKVKEENHVWLCFSVGFYHVRQLVEGSQNFYQVLPDGVQFNGDRFWSWGYKYRLSLLPTTADTFIEKIDGKTNGVGGVELRVVPLSHREGDAL